MSKHTNTQSSEQPIHSANKDVKMMDGMYSHKETVHTKSGEYKDTSSEFGHAQAAKAVKGLK